MAGNALRLVISISASADSARSVAKGRVIHLPRPRPRSHNSLIAGQIWEVDRITGQRRRCALPKVWPPRFTRTFRGTDASCSSMRNATASRKSGALSRPVPAGRAVGPVSGGFWTGTQRSLRGADAGISTDSKKRLAADHRKQGSGGQTALLARRQADLFHTGPQWQPQRAGRALDFVGRPARFELPTY